MIYTCDKSLFKLIDPVTLDRIFSIVQDQLELNIDVDIFRENLHGITGSMDIEDGVVQLYIDSSIRDVHLIARIIFHEMAHAKQMTEGKFVFGKGREKFWEGTDYSHVEYSDTPWEKDANEIEDKLFILFVEGKDNGSS